MNHYAHVNVLQIGFQSITHFIPMFGIGKLIFENDFSPHVCIKKDSYTLANKRTALMILDSVGTWRGKFMKKLHVVLGGIEDCESTTVSWI